MPGGTHRSHVVLMVSGDFKWVQKHIALDMVAIETNKQFIDASP